MSHGVGTSGDFNFLLPSTCVSLRDGEKECTNFTATKQLYIWLQWHQLDNFMATETKQKTSPVIAQIELVFWKNNALWSFKYVSWLSRQGSTHLLTHIGKQSYHAWRLLSCSASQKGEKPKIKIIEGLAKMMNSNKNKDTTFSLVLASKFRSGRVPKWTRKCTPVSIRKLKLGSWSALW